jgi:antitoxin component YwqK of YwqJK toxin-antitoxin module
MKRNIISPAAIIVVVICSAFCWMSCGENNKSFEKITVDNSLIDSVKKVSDSSYVKPYYSGYFASATYYLNSADSTLMQVMKDSSNKVRQVIIAKNNKRLYFTQYYANGQLMASYYFNADGQNDGESKEYFENGAVSMSGKYSNGLRTGKWKNFNEKGEYLFSAVYNNNGQQVSTSQE